MFDTSRLLRAGVALLAAGSTLSCSRAQVDEFLGNVEPEPYPVVLLVERDPGMPIAQVPVFYRGKQVKATNEEGMVSLHLQRPDGEEVELQVQCPPDTKPVDPLRITVRRVQGARHLERRIRCAPLIRHIAVSVRADNGPNLPVSYLGNVMAITDASGAAHFLLDAAPGQAIKLRIDASGNPKLKPAADEVAFRVEDADDMFSVYSKFTEEKKIIRVRPRASGPRPL